MRFTLESLQAIPQEIRERIRFLVETASANGSTISLNELRLLMPENRFSTDNVLKDFLDVDERLSGLLTETQGEITVRGREDLVEARKSQRRLARARIVQADEFLHTLSRICPWIELMFHRLFAARLGEAGSTDDEPRDKAHSVGTIANAVAFLVLGPYLLLAGMVRNVRLRKSGRGRECFNTLIQPDRYATESL